MKVFQYMCKDVERLDCEETEAKELMFWTVKREDLRTLIADLKLQVHSREDQPADFFGKEMMLKLGNSSRLHAA